MTEDSVPGITHGHSPTQSDRERALLYAQEEFERMAQERTAGYV